MDLKIKLLKRIVVVIVCFLASICAGAQTFSVSTNLGRWAELGTMNVEGGYAFSQHFSVHVNVAINPFTFRAEEADERYEDVMANTTRAFQYKRESVGVSVRWWPWYVFSGWWVRAKVQYMAYDIGGIQTPQRHVGNAFGAGLGAGYSFMLGQEWNIDVGVAGWGGYRIKDVYESINTNSKPIDNVRGWYLWPEEIVIAITHVF